MNSDEERRSRPWLRLFMQGGKERVNLNEMIRTGLGITAVVLTLVEITPVKINPWSTIARVIGKVFNQSVLQKIDQMEDRLSTMEKDIKHIQEESSEQRAISCRARILRFGDEVLHGQRHTKDHFDQILIDIRDYDAYCKEHPGFENNITGMTSERIKNVYRDRLERNDFL